MIKLVQSLKSKVQSRRFAGLGLALFGLWTLDLGLWTPPLRAAFEDTGTGARGAALGDNYVSMGDDVLSLMYNPAALARVQQKEIASEYSRLYSGLSDGSNITQSYLGYGQPISWGGTLAFGWKQFGDDALYKERTLSLGYGEWLTSDVAIGGAVKQLYHAFGAPNIVVDNNGNVQSGTPNFFAQNGNSNTAYAADLGALYKWSPRSTLGFSVQNVNEPNVALNPADHDIVSKTIRLGTSYEADRHLTLGMGVMRHKGLTSETDTVWTGSAEKWWTLAGKDGVAVRGSVATGSREFQQAAFGAGYRFGSFELDYAFMFNMTGLTPGNTAGTHRFSFDYRFGPKGYPAKSKARTKRPQHKPMPQGYEPAARKADVQVGVEPLQRKMPRAAEITITPEDIDGSKVPPKGADISIDVIFDADFDGVPDERDACPNTLPGVAVDANGCAQSQIDHHGNPLPHKATIEFLPLNEVENGH